MGVPEKLHPDILLIFHVKNLQRSFIDLFLIAAFQS